MAAHELARESLAALEADEARDNARMIVKIDADAAENKKSVAACGVTGLPTMVLIRDGQEVTRIGDELFGEGPKAPVIKAMLEKL